MFRGHPGVVTKLTKEVDTLLTDLPTSEQIVHLNIVYEQFENKMRLLQTYDSEIAKLCKTDKVAQEIDKSVMIFTKILEYKRCIMSAYSDDVCSSNSYT